MLCYEDDKSQCLQESDQFTKTLPGAPSTRPPDLAHMFPSLGSNWPGSDCSSREKERFHPRRHPTPPHPSPWVSADFVKSNNPLPLPHKIPSDQENICVVAPSVPPSQAALQRKLSPVDVETRPDARWNQPVQPQTLAHFQSIGSTEVELPHTRRTCVTQHRPGGECRSGCAYCFFTPERKCNLSSFAVACMFDRFSPGVSPRQLGQLHHQLRFPRKHLQKEKTSKQGFNFLLVKQRRKGSRPNTLPWKAVSSFQSKKGQIYTTRLKWHRSDF